MPIAVDSRPPGKPVVRRSSERGPFDDASLEGCLSATAGRQQAGRRYKTGRAGLKPGLYRSRAQTEVCATELWAEDRWVRRLDIRIAGG